MEIKEAKEIIKNFKGTMFIDGCKGQMSDNDLIEIAKCMESLKEKSGTKLNG